ncbi:cytochrome c oxidase accessory protein CcoG [Thalassomonas viridans]|uniref:Cytochrome c oxidase accessory protein CcoG n=1 Tax=Thalassomonas viridans TaxID=137584 RepID=A0AAE9Z2P1_9GAMM|nr:cytochrome c oxidase accessory protein CcoG [Thalassomonas viridans]WDE05137.1 cytochrome c oxidase accessory protein CcoG [Thalassomonas viridans]
MKFDFKEEDLIIKPYKTPGPVYVRKQKGLFQKIRRYTGVIFVLLFALLPWVNYQGKQAILLDIGKQQFHFFGITLFPQDFTLLAWFLIIAAFLLFFITTWLGRIWCGYLCPQTVWAFTYIWIEEKIEGTRNQRMRLDKASMTAGKVAKKLLKHAIWLALSFLTATTFITYFVPATSLYAGLLELEWSALVTFWVIFFTLCTYGNAGWIREKMCIYFCPYSRFQSAMFDQDTLLVAYDKKRGENRGARRRKDNHKQLGLGDCVDCNLCVEVCPAGIDIRNGLQYECINCGACIDACDQTMDKFGYAKGLISYTSENALARKKSPVLRPKILGYGSLSICFVILMGITMHSRVPVEVSVLRDRNVLFRTNYLDEVENSYQLKLINKSQQPQVYQLNVLGVDNVKSSLTEPIEVAAGEMLSVPVTLTVARENIKYKVTNLQFVIQAENNADIHLLKETRFYSD